VVTRREAINSKGHYNTKLALSISWLPDVPVPASMDTDGFG